jgi:hypothetical protein
VQNLASVGFSEAQAEQRIASPVPGLAARTIQTSSAPAGSAKPPQGVRVAGQPKLIFNPPPFSKIYNLLGTAQEPGGIERLYERTPTASFSDEVLERYPTNLAVLPVHGIEWSDLGEPLRVMTVLSRLGIHPDRAAP